MSKKIFSVLLAFHCLISFAQDTTWVQTFTYDSITSRRSNFVFPQDLNNKRFEKVLMYYKLKCSPLTSWDQYNCGEWDYLTYTRVFDHTGQFDSVKVDGYRFLANWEAPIALNYVPAPNTLADTYSRTESYRTNTTLVHSDVVTAGLPIASPFPFQTASHGGVYQMLLTATELNAAGIVAGDVQSLSLYIASFAGGSILSPTISIKSTTDSDLIGYHTFGFTEVYNASRKMGGIYPELVMGVNEFLFYQPFAWNGTDNLIIEFTFENTMPSTGSLSFEVDNDASSMSASYDGLNGNMQFDGTNYAMLELSDFDLGNEMTITFWAKGTGSAGTNTSILEAYDTLNNRVINLHFPWSDNSMYFDAGMGSGYDRINKAMTVSEIDNTWNHWAFVKKQSTGEMFIYKNGVLWHSGTGKNLPIGYIHRLVLGSNMNQAYLWKGKIDEFQLYNTALTQSTIQSYMEEQPDATHPNWSSLLAYYDFDDQPWAIDRSASNKLLMPSEKGMIHNDEHPLVGWNHDLHRPRLGLGQGVVAGAVASATIEQQYVKEPLVIFEQQPVNRHFEISNAYLALEEGAEVTYGISGDTLSQVPFSATQQELNDTVTYFNQPYELVNDVEIARYITPYGISFDLGPNGFAWIYDVTDYQQYLKDTVDLAAHNTQELLDLKFAFIEGIPPRDVHKREPIWADFRSYQFSNMADNTVLPEVPIVLSDSSEMFKIKTRLSGHGQVGNAACCEWVPNDHQIKVDGVSRFNWNIWQTTECGDNPNTGQGGTWPYAREGWCPGDQVRENEFELTPFVQPGDTARIDYVINNVPSFDPGQASGNYIVAMDMISYGAPNFQHDAAIYEVLTPNNWEYLRKWNPACTNPKVVIQNTGEQPLTKCIIRCWISYGDWLEYEWTGNLAFLEKETVEIPVTDLGWWRDYNGTQTFTAQVYAIEGYPDLDEYHNNNVKSTKFDAPESINGPFFVWFITNNKANENKYRLEDANGNILFERNALANNTTYKDTFNLDPGCYSLILEDSDHDGLSFWYSSQVEGETSGQFRVRLVGGTYVEIFPGDFGHYHRYNFSVGFTLGLDEQELTHQIDVYPNPTNGNCTIELSGEVENDAKLMIYDLLGRQVFNENMISTENFAELHPDLSFLPSGQYLIKIVTGTRVYTKELIRQ